MSLMGIGWTFDLRDAEEDVAALTASARAALALIRDGEGDAIVVISDLEKAIGDAGRSRVYEDGRMRISAQGS